MLKKLFSKLQLTEYEGYAIFILLLFGAGGISVNIFSKNGGSSAPFEYKQEDKLFEKIVSGDYSKNNQEINSRDIDSLSVVSEFNKDNKNKNAGISGGERININTADLAEICRLPGIGEKTAQKIIDLRNRLGKFSSVNQLLIVKGIGDKKLQQIKPYISL